MKNSNIMKKVFLAVVLALSFAFCASAQDNDGKDGLFTDWKDVSNSLDEFDEFDEFNEDPTRDPSLPGGHNGGDTPAPLGSGLVVLTALGAGYDLVRRKRDE